MSIQIDTIPAVGDTFTFAWTTGYLVHQNRPQACYYGCRCGTCNGVTRQAEAVVVEVIHWADNSIDVVGYVDGVRRTQQMTPPSGDACY